MRTLIQSTTIEELKAHVFMRQGSRDRYAMRKDVIQVAAIALRWAAACDGDGPEFDDGEEVSNASGARSQGRSEWPWTWSDASSAKNGWPIEPDVGRVAHGLAARVDRLRCIGNGQVPTVAAAAFVMLARRFEVTK